MIVPNPILLEWECPVPRPDPKTVITSYATALACLEKAEGRFESIKTDVANKVKEAESVNGVR